MTDVPTEPLVAVALNCSLKSSSEESSTDLILAEVCEELRSHEVVVGPVIRVVDLDIVAGVTSDEGEGDAWPSVREKILAADILVVGTPIWLGQPSSVAKRVLERMDAFLGETDEQGRMISVGRVAMVAVVGNEDGAHHVSAELFQALNDVGFTLAAGAVTYWVGEAMKGVDYKDLEHRPAKTSEATTTSVRNTVHLAGLLDREAYPAPPG